MCQEGSEIMLNSFKSFQEVRYCPVTLQVYPYVVEEMPFENHFRILKAKAFGHER